MACSLKQLFQTYNIAKNNEANMPLSQKDLIGRLSLENLAKSTGFGNNPSMYKRAVSRVKAGNEKVTANGNAFIVLGLDRGESKYQGYGGYLADANSNTIDLVVGLGKHLKERSSDEKDKIVVENNFINDSARVYISELCDVDEKFGLKVAKNSDIPNSKTRSAVAIKADGVRIIGREGIRLIAGRVHDTEMNQVDSSIDDTGVELSIANSTAELQPMVLGNNLIKALKDLNDRLNKLGTLMSNHITEQIMFDAAIAAHTHLSVFGNTPDPGILSRTISKMVIDGDIIMTSEIEKTINSAVSEMQATEPFSADYILSQYHKLD